MIILFLLKQFTATSQPGSEDVIIVTSDVSSAILWTSANKKNKRSLKTQVKGLVLFPGNNCNYIF